MAGDDPGRAPDRDGRGGRGNSRTGHDETTALGTLVARAVEIVGPEGNAVRLVLMRLARRRPGDAQARRGFDRALPPGDL